MLETTLHPAAQVAGQGIFAWYSIKAMKAWLIVGILASIMGQPIQKRQDSRDTQKYDQIGEQASPPTIPPVSEQNGQPTPSVDHHNPDNANRDWRQAFDPPTWSNWALVVVGFGAIIAALWTLRVIKRQTKATETASEAARDNATAAKRSAEFAENSLVLLNRAYLRVDNWKAFNVPPYSVGAEFRIFNPSLTAARIETIEIKFRETTTTVKCGRMLTPNEGYLVSVPPEELAESDAALISGRVTYTDIFRKTRHRKFAQNCLCSLGVRYFSEAEGAALNDEEEWDKDDQQRQNPN